MSESSQEGWASWWKATSESLSTQMNELVANLPSNEEVRGKLEEWSAKAGDYLDEADRRIEQFESSAVDSLRAVGDDLKHMMDEPLALEGPAAEPQAGGVLFSSERIATSRLEAQIKQLHQSPKPFCTKSLLPGNVDDRTDEIAECLETYPELRKLFESLVPETVEYTQFWLKYFAARDEILEADRQRKALLAKPAEEIEDWGDSDEEPAAPEPPAANSQAPAANLQAPAANSQAPPAANSPAAAPAAARSPAQPVTSQEASEAAAAAAVGDILAMRSEDGDSDSDWE